MDKIIKKLTRLRLIYLIIIAFLLLVIVYVFASSSKAELLPEQIYQQLEPLRQPLANVRGSYDYLLLIADSYLQLVRESYKLIIIFLSAIITAVGGFVLALTSYIKKIRIEQNFFNNDSKNT